MSVVKNKETGKWDAWFYVRGTDGKLRKKAKKGFVTKNAAQQYEATHKHESASEGGVTFGWMFEELSKYNRASEETTATRRQRLRDYAGSVWSMPFKRISKEVILAWRSELAATTLATSTKNDIIGYVKQVGRYAYEVYDLPDNTKVLKTFPKELEDIKEMQIINYEQFQKLIAVEEDEVLRVFFQFLFMTGCRKGEARALLKSDVNGPNISLHKAMRRYYKSLRTTKTRSQRLVRLDNDTFSKISELCKREGPYLFGDYAPLSLTKIDDHFKKDLEKAGLPNIRIHDLRHSNVSMLWAAGVPIPEISKRIGHSSPKVTMETYAHIFDNAQTASVDFLNSLKK